MMTEDKRTFDSDGLPAFPWRSDDNGVIWSREGEPVLSDVFGVAIVVTEAMNTLAEDGWFQPVSAYHEELYNELAATTNALGRRTETLRRAVELIETYRENGTPVDVIDVLHDVLTMGGSTAYAYVPCRFEVISGIGEEGMCIAQGTEEYAGVRYCKPHYLALQEVKP